MIRAKRAAAAALGPVAALLLGGCTAALKEPPPVAELAGGGASAAATGIDAVALVRRADAEMAKAPDGDAVARARALYLEAAKPGAASADALIGACVATAWLLEHEADADRRKTLATEGVQIGQWCVRLYPDEIECSYRLALAVGQQARERSSTAVDGLDVMVELLGTVIDADPELDFAGGHRVLALVLLRAPGWPTGPGDPDLALEHARAAAALFPDYPPNQLVLGEALAAVGETVAARAAIERGIELARAADEFADSGEWASDGERALAELR